VNESDVAAAIVTCAPMTATTAPGVMAAPTCFTVYDRQGEIVYRDTALPFEGAADPKTPGRTAMRERGEHLVFFEADFCVPVAAKGPDTRPATTDEIVAAIPSYGTGGRGTGASSKGGIFGSGSAAPASESRPDVAVVRGGPAGRIAAPAAAAIQSRGASMR